MEENWMPILHQFWTVPKMCEPILRPFCFGQENERPFSLGFRRLVFLHLFYVFWLWGGRCFTNCVDCRMEKQWLRGVRRLGRPRLSLQCKMEEIYGRWLGFSLETGTRAWVIRSKMDVARTMGTKWPPGDNRKSMSISCAHVSIHSRWICIRLHNLSVRTRSTTCGREDLPF